MRRIHRDDCRLLSDHPGNASADCSCPPEPPRAPPSGETAVAEIMERSATRREELAALRRRTGLDTGETRSTVRCQTCGHTGVPSPTVVLDLEAEICELKAELAGSRPSLAPAPTQSNSGMQLAALVADVQRLADYATELENTVKGGGTFFAPRDCAGFAAATRRVLTELRSEATPKPAALSSSETPSGPVTDEEVQAACSTYDTEYPRCVPFVFPIMRAVLEGFVRQRSKQPHDSAGK